jgi:deoxyribodipyrimidine photo-lyase
MARPPAKPRILLYILRRDTRLSDNPIFHQLSLLSSQDDTPGKQSQMGGPDAAPIHHADSPDFTHLLPVYIFPANQVEISGFLESSSDHSPYPEARSHVAGVWRTGPHRAKFMAEGVWNLKDRLESLGCDSGLQVRVGMTPDVIEQMLDWYSEETEHGGPRAEIAGIWMTSDQGVEEKADEMEVKNLAASRDIAFKLWDDEKYFLHEYVLIGPHKALLTEFSEDLPFNKDKLSELPDIFTTYRKSLEPLRSRPRPTLPTPTRLPPLPPDIPPQSAPFEVPNDLSSLKERLLSPLERDPTFGLPVSSSWPTGVQPAESAHPFSGGEAAAQERLQHLISSGAMSSYKTTRNGLLGLDFSTKLSAYLAQGHLTARQIHWAMVGFEDGKGDGKEVESYGKGENDGTAHVRFELVWRDYMRLCLMKYGDRFYHLDGIQEPHGKYKKQSDSGRPPRKRWKHIGSAGSHGSELAKNRKTFERFCSGRTGTGLIDASNRELFFTGYTSNRARQNVASYIAVHLGIDWRVGAEWYESMLVDHDAASNWGNWQYVSGVGMDPRPDRKFNPVKQALGYDREGKYIKAWVPELRGVELSTEGREIDQDRMMGLCQAFRLSDSDKKRLGLKGLDWVENPLIKIDFVVNRNRAPNVGGQGGRDRGRGRGPGPWGVRGRSRDFRRLGNEDRSGWTRDENETPAA